MVEAKQLMIGNYIKYLDPRIVQIDESLMYNLCVNGYDNWYEYIPLTEEWLLKFGFAKVMTYYWNIDLKRKLEVTLFDVKKWVVYLREENSEGSDDYATLTRQLENVHELQNLFYALTKEELTIKEPIANDSNV